MNTLENRLAFVDAYASLCRKHGFYIDTPFPSHYLRVFALDDVHEQKQFQKTYQCLLKDIGAIGSE